MGAFIEPSLLQIIGLGTEGDPYLPDGRHLRWLMHRELGFPRSGFHLVRRRSLAPWNEKVVLAMGVLRQQSLVQGSLTPAEATADGGLRCGSGLTVHRAGGLAFQTALPFPWWPRASTRPRCGWASGRGLRCRTAPIVTIRRPT